MDFGSLDKDQVSMITAVQASLEEKASLDSIDSSLFSARVARVHGTLPSAALYTAWSELEVPLIRGCQCGALSPGTCLKCGLQSPIGRFGMYRIGGSTTIASRCGPMAQP